MTDNQNTNEIFNEENTSQSVSKPINKKIITILSIMLIFIIGGIILLGKWNVIMGNSKCKSGDYETALKYYVQEINDGTYNTNIKIRYEALSAYVSAESLQH